MEESKLFRAINRINSTIFFLLLLGAVVFISIIIFQTNECQNRRAVAVVENHGSDDAKRIELILGNLQEIHGHDAQYVELSSRRKGGKLSSGYSGGQTKNILFFVGPNLESHWLFEDHSNLILVMSRLNRVNEKDKSKFTEALFYEIVKVDSNSDGELSSDDLSIIALSKPDGTGYQEVETKIQSVIDRKVIDKGNYLMLLLQSENKVFLKKYSLSDFSKVSEKVINEVSKKL